MVRVKMCGFVRVQDAEFAVKIGVHAIGLIFYNASPRQVTIKQAQEIVKEIGPFVATVGLFVNASYAEIKAVVDAVKLDYLQFHGDETADFCNDIGIPYIKAIRLGGKRTFQSSLELFLGDYGANGNLKALLLDSSNPYVYGGSGESFDWQKLWPCDNAVNYPLILAGGLNVDNVAQAVAITKPYAVDICGGVEDKKLMQGCKNHAKMLEFMQSVTGMVR